MRADRRCDFCGALVPQDRGGRPGKTTKCRAIECQREYGRIRAARHRHRTMGPFCDVSGCERPTYYSSTWCRLHHRRVERTGSTGPAGSLRTVRHITGQGYVEISKLGHPNAAKKNGAILEHRWVMAESLGRPLIRGEEVHHRNGDRTDNRRVNLELWSSSQPAGQRVEDKADWAVEILRLYRPDALSSAHRIESAA
jgi:hypothetical protein